MVAVKGGNMKLILIISLLFVCNICEAETVWHRYTDIATGEERGVARSGRDGTPCINNPDWKVEVIPDGRQDYYISLQRKQLEEKRKVKKDALKAKRKAIRNKLKKGIPLTDEDCDFLLGQND